MAHLWQETLADGWTLIALDDATGRFPLPGHGENADEDGSRSACILRWRGPEEERWMLLAGARAGVRVNGTPLVLGARVLCDRDEIRPDGAVRFYFSTERLARVEALPASDRPVFCPRCKQQVVEDVPAVACPQCGVWHHQTEETPCWTYTATCALCDQPTELQAGYRWTPAEI